MFDLSPDAILTLHDELLRELVGRLCEAELEALGLSPCHVYWGGDHKAADGGLDVSVRLPKSTQISGFIPKPITGFQVKKSDMPAAAITKEMAPTGRLRTSIQKLARDGGAYIIVSAKSNTTEIALEHRLGAMTKAVQGMRNRRKLLTDFYERSRLLSWVRCHPGVALWLASKLGKATAGWHPHGAWAARPLGSDPGFLVNKKRRIYCGSRGEEPLSDADALTTIRAQLAHPGASIRLVGLSGVGKTRFAEQLFAPADGQDSLPSSQVFYADTSESPEPSPVGMAERLVAMQKPVYLVVDNCPSDTHRSLSNLARRSGSQLRVVTIEFDIRDDQPEGTQVIRLEQCDNTTIEALLRSRFSHLSGVDIQRISEFSGGNARLAIVAAESWLRSGPKSGMSDADLFHRIFAQRNTGDDSLLKAAQAAALVYSFSVESSSSELRKLSSLCDMTEGDFHRRIDQLRDRGVAQARSNWRAILPHAIANRLAIEALTAWPPQALERAIVDLAHPRLLISFTRRLGFLHKSDVAVRLVREWLASDGVLGRPEAFDSVHASMFTNLASVCPWETLGALEAVGHRIEEDRASDVWALHAELLRLLSYEADMFTQAARMLSSAALIAQDAAQRETAARALVSLFPACLSGTHASIEQRMACVQAVATRHAAGAAQLAVQCLDASLESEHFSSSHLFSFGAQSRDYGYSPPRPEDTLHWFQAALTQVRKLSEKSDARELLRPMLARRLSGLLHIGGLEDELVAVAKSLAEGPYWPEGWKACRRALARRTERLPPTTRRKLRALEAALAPRSLEDKVRAFLVGDFLLDALDESEGDAAFKNAEQRLERAASELGERLVEDSPTLCAMLPALLRTGGRTLDLGQAMARTSPGAKFLWNTILEALGQVPEKERNYSLPVGILRGLSDRSRQLAEEVLDDCVEHFLMAVAFPNLQAAVGVRSADVSRILRAIDLKRAPVQNFAHFAYGRATDDCGAAELARIIVKLAAEPGGVDPALEILWMRLGNTKRHGSSPEIDIVKAGQEVLMRMQFESAHADARDYRMIQVLEHCLVGPEAGSVAAKVASRVRAAMAAGSLWGIHARRIIRPLLETESMAVLDELLGESGARERLLSHRWDDSGERDADPWGVVPAVVWKDWCSRDPAVRYAQAAAVIEPRSGTVGGVAQWSDIALALFTCAPHPEDVLNVFVNRFQPNCWSGSRAAIMERHLRLLESLNSQIVARMSDQFERAIEHMRVAIARDRRWEKEYSRTTDERFE